MQEKQHQTLLAQGLGYLSSFELTTCHSLAIAKAIAKGIDKEIAKGMHKTI